MLKPVEPIDFARKLFDLRLKPGLASSIRAFITCHQPQTTLQVTFDGAVGDVLISYG